MPRKSTGKVDWRTIHSEQKESGIRKRMTLDEFRRAWIKAKGPAQDKSDERFLYGQGLKDFFEDYMCSDSKNVWEYLRGTSKRGW